ncbi:MAG: glycosyltransferase family 4 protein [Planctomyces sp.]|nr:glycosyltransferase family 4 protein [Planctomyces sp.]
MAVQVAFVTTHPIQYQAPLFRLLAARSDIDLTVLFCHMPGKDQQGVGFGVQFEWDIPLLDGYRWQLLENVSNDPGSSHFRGCDTPGIGRKLQELQVDAVIVNGWGVKSTVQTLRACRRLGLPCIVRGESNLLPRRPRWKQWLQRALVRRYSAQLCIGQRNREFYRHYGIPDRQMFFCPYCVENRRFQVPGRDERGAAFRERMGIPGDVVCYLFSGKLIPKKHPVDLLDAFRMSVEAGSPAHLMIVGDGPLRPECEAIAARIPGRVHFTGFVNQGEIADAYAAADCLVLPSDCWETWGLVVNEAMASGRPAIVSDQVGCVPDLIRDGETGWKFSHRDWGALANVLREQASDRDRLHAMGRRAEAHVAGYSPEQAVEGMVEAVRFVTSARVAAC